MNSCIVLLIFFCHSENLFPILALQSSKYQVTNLKGAQLYPFTPLFFISPIASFASSTQFHLINATIKGIGSVLSKTLAFTEPQVLSSVKQFEMPNPFRMSGTEFISYSKFMTETGVEHVNVTEACRFTQCTRLNWCLFCVHKKSETDSEPIADMQSVTLQRKYSAFSKYPNMRYIGKLV